jgi:hypothetical protein
MDEAQARARLVNLVEDIRYNYGGDAAESAARVAAATLHAISSRLSDDPNAIPEFHNPLAPPVLDQAEPEPKRKDLWKRMRISRRFMVIETDRERQSTQKRKPGRPGEPDEIDLASVEA